MKGISEIVAENDAIIARIRKREAASLKRLKQRIARIVYDPLKPARFVRRDINEAIDEWHAAERKRGSR